MDWIDNILNTFIPNGYSDEFYTSIGIGEIDYPESTTSNADVESIMAGENADYSAQVMPEEEYTYSPTKPASGNALTGLLSEASKFIDKNGKALEFGAKAVGGAYSASQARKATEAKTVADKELLTMRLDAEQKARDDVLKEKADTRKRISDSIIGLGQPQQTGLIPLMTRMNGQRVFNDNGSMVR